MPPPPEPFDALTHLLAGGSGLNRVHHQSREATAFNPGRGMPTRFAPFNVDGAPIPTLYAAASATAAVCESILHDVPLSGGLLPAARYEQYVESGLRVTRDLRLAMLKGEGLRRLGVSPQQLTATEGDVYGSTVHWARAAHAAGFEGVVWMSARDNSAEAYMLFGDRVAADDLMITAEGAGRLGVGTDGFRWLSAYCSLVKVDVLLE
ncbi:RES family NAD+ phosphorylase [Agrococcus beijingensis]|uniref:RES family NAD+ phosphorylase n=1 Tax=Agrococcus beijingensis TaxID=3068634 RepID=UPI0027422DD8|nr:RES family NAD+ phosphorylase [Agrococcus sp. REN33]